MIRIECYLNGIYTSTIVSDNVPRIGDIVFLKLNKVSPDEIGIKVACTVILVEWLQVTPISPELVGDTFVVYLYLVRKDD